MYLLRGLIALISFIVSGPSLSLIFPISSLGVSLIGPPNVTLIGFGGFFVVLTLGGVSGFGAFFLTILAYVGVFSPWPCCFCCCCCCCFYCCCGGGRVSWGAFLRVSLAFAATDFSTVCYASRFA